MRLSELFAAAIAAGFACASPPQPIVLPPSEWLGIDGNWSTIKLDIGSNSQSVNVLASTALSELWVIGPGGCVTNEPHCNDARGGIYHPSESNKWQSLGIWQLGLDYPGLGGNGDYGLDSVNQGLSNNGTSLTMSDVLISALNTTDYFIGQLGLGIVQGSFGDRVADSPLTQAVQTFRLIPSYSYGYTAGAHYRNAESSVILGGYDSARFNDHNTEFTLSQADSMPRPLVRGIQAAASANHSLLSQWQFDTFPLSTWNNTYTAELDSSTPFLWLPDAVCDNFASALNLTYNNTLDLYTLSNELYNYYRQEDSVSFTFSLSSLDNTNSFGSPLDVDGVVNITVPARAFVSTVQYPFNNEAIKYGDPAIPYFSLKKGGNSTFVLGRSFLQESYLITKYDEGTFSIHQAIFGQSADVQAIAQTADSPYPSPGAAAGSHGLTQGQIAGIVVGSVMATLVILTAAFFWWHKRRNSRVGDDTSLEETKRPESSLSSQSAPTPMSRFLSVVARRKRTPKTLPPAPVLTNQITEAPDHEIYELPAPMPPAELDASDDNASLDGTELGTDSTQNISAYETARRKMERQLRGPVPEYSPPANGVLPLSEKEGDDTVQMATRQHVEQPSPVSPMRTDGATDYNTNSLPNTLPSPITPRGDDSSRSHQSHEMPSPLTATAPEFPASTLARSHSGPGQTAGHRTEGQLGTSRSNSNSPASVPHTFQSDLPSQTARIQRTPIDPSKVICLGPLPEHVRPQRQNTANRDALDNFEHARHGYDSEDSLGSNYTEEEEELGREMMRLAGQGQPHDVSARDVTDEPQQPARRHQATENRPEDESHGQDSPGRIDPGCDLVHVPQMASKRYSWEEH